MPLAVVFSNLLLEGIERLGEVHKVLRIQSIFLLQQKILFRNFAENESCMRKKEALQLFGDKTIRTAWSEDDEKWYFSIIDVVYVLTDSVDASAYWRKLKERLL